LIECINTGHDILSVHFPDADFTQLSRCIEHIHETSTRLGIEATYLGLK